jgi:hypothetical protein
MAAGPWYSSSGIGDANNAATARGIMAALTEANKNQEAAAHPVMQSMLAKDAGVGQMLGALGYGVTFADLGSGKLAAAVEGTSPVTLTNFSTTNVTVTPSRKSFARQVSDYSRSLQAGLLMGEIGPDVEALLAYEGTRVWLNSLVDQIAALASSATNTIGSTGVPLTWSALNEGILDLKNRGAAQGRALGLVTVKGAKDLADDALSLGGAVAMAPQIQQLLANASAGAYVGSFGAVDVYLNSELDTDSGDDLGMLLTDGAIISKHQQVALPREADALINAGFYTMEMRRADGGVTNIETVAYNGVAIAENGRMAAIRYVS